MIACDGYTSGESPAPETYTAVMMSRKRMLADRSWEKPLGDQCYWDMETWTASAASSDSHHECVLLGRVATGGRREVRPPVLVQIRAACIRDGCG